MNIIANAAPAAPLRRRSNTVPRSTRDQGALTAAPLEIAKQRKWSKRERELLRHLLSAIRPDGSADPVSRAELATSAAKMQDLYYSGLVMGAGSRDARGMGNTPESSWWWLTTAGEALARALAQEGR